MSEMKIDEGDGGGVQDWGYVIFSDVILDDFCEIKCAFNHLVFF